MATKCEKKSCDGYWSGIFLSLSHSIWSVSYIKHSFEKPLTAGCRPRYGHSFSSRLIPLQISCSFTKIEAATTYSLIQPFLSSAVRFYPNATRPVIILVFLPSAFQQLEAVKEKPPQAKCYSSLLVFEVTASWAAEAAACGLWLVGLLKIWSLTFQVRMSHRHWSHNWSCAIIQVYWEKKKVQSICVVLTQWVTTVLLVCVCVCALEHAGYPHPPTHAALQPLTQALLLPLLYFFTCLLLRPKEGDG